MIHISSVWCRGKRWGAEMDLGRRTVQQGNVPLPSKLNALIERMQSVGLLRDFRPNEANAIDYCKSKGHWLKQHVDDRCTAGICHCILQLILMLPYRALP